MPLDRLGLDVRAWIPQIDGAVQGRTGKHILIGGKIDAGTLVLVAGKLKVALGVGKVP